MIRQGRTTTRRRARGRSICAVSVNTMAGDALRLDHAARPRVLQPSRAASASTGPSPRVAAVTAVAGPLDVQAGALSVDLAISRHSSARRSGELLAVREDTRRCLESHKAHEHLWRPCNSRANWPSFAHGRSQKRNKTWLELSAAAVRQISQWSSPAVSRAVVCPRRLRYRPRLVLSLLRPAFGCDDA